MNYQFKYKKYVEALYAALKEDPFYFTMEQSVSINKSSKDAMLRYLEYSMLESEKYGELFIPSEHEYGVSVWSKPLNSKLQAQKTQEKKSFFIKNMGQQSLNTYRAIIKFMSDKATPLIDDNLWYLSIVGILPEFQNKGLGSTLVKEVLKKSDMKGVATYLETFTSKNMTFYERLGYHVIESFFEPTIKAKYWLMVRDCPNIK